MTGIFEKKVSPSNCALAIALPLTKEEFLADLRPEASKDYASYYCSLMGVKRGHEALWTVYRDNISTLIEGVAAEVESLGVKVVRQVKLADMPSLLSDRDVVSLVSHWRGADVEAQDFVDFPCFVNKLSTSCDDVIVYVRQKLSSSVMARARQFKATSGNDFLAFRNELIDELNGLLESENLGRRPGFDISETEQRLHVEQRKYLNRMTLDAAFAGDLNKGNRMEFFDGLQPAEAIRERIPDSFAGLLDLIVCNSVLPAEVIKLMKRNGLIIANQFPAKPSFRLLLYKTIIRSLHYQPDTFVDTTMKVRQKLGNYLKNYE
jgi:hypothetical protein